jgi:ribosomal protein L7Ae-like RNA K-turn-binding protein
MDFAEALPVVVKEAINGRAIAKGLNEACRALDQRHAVLCLLAENCNDANYKSLITALCSEHQISLVKSMIIKHLVNGWVCVNSMKMAKLRKLSNVHALL